MPTAKTSEIRKVRNVVAANSRCRSKKFADRRMRRASDARRSWKNEEN